MMNDFEYLYASVIMIMSYVVARKCKVIAI